MDRLGSGLTAWGGGRNGQARVWPHSLGGEGMDRLGSGLTAWGGGRNGQARDWPHSLKLQLYRTSLDTNMYTMQSKQPSVYKQLHVQRNKHQWITSG